MKKWTYASLFLLTLAGAARAQYYVRPPTNPYFRPQLSPYFTYYHGPGGMGGAYVVPPALARGGVYPGTVPLGGYGAGGVAVPHGGGEGAAAEAALNANVTGHPTRFMAYSQYFLNQGGGTGGTAAAGQPAQPFGTAVLGTGSFQRPAQAGAAPPRGRVNTRPGGR